ncbi:MAG: lysine--tRNA ligase [Desulfurococcaceae archaeon]
MVKHWIDELADQLYEKLTGRGAKEVYVFNGGLSVSGLQHVGRLRGEIIIGETLRRILTARGLRIKQYLTLYTQDAWKGKEAQVSTFRDPEQGKRYTGWPLIKVPDPYGCHSNWVEHYWEDFGPFIKEFTDGEVEVVTTTELYKWRLGEFIKLTLEKKEEVRRVLNKYRGRKPYPEGWIPFEAVCEKCGRIDTTEAVRVVDEDHVEYVCTSCGHRGVSSLENGKLMWRIEWTGVWWTLGVDFEPFGKDHAMPGGSRDSCVDLAVNVYRFKPPEGLPYEWVELKQPNGRVVDMGSSDFLGFTPREWLEVAHPHVFRFLVLRTPPFKKLAVGLHEVPHYYSLYYRAERVYYGLEKTASEEEKVLLARSYELSYPRGGPPREPPEQVPYLHLAILSQLVPRELWTTEAIARLKNTGHLPDAPTEYGLRRVLETLPRALNWVHRYGPRELIVTLNTLDEARWIAGKIPSEYEELFKHTYENLSSLEAWTEESIKEALVKVTSKLTPDAIRAFYEYLYMLICGRSSGPRIAPLLALMGRNQALAYLSITIKELESRKESRRWQPIAH